ncbi:MAG: radical SAM protein [bacterium]
MKNRILLIWPHLAAKERLLATPLWSLCLAAYLKSKISNIDIRILDGQINSLDTISREINRFKPDIVGISPLIHHYNIALEFARKSKLTGARVVFGGEYASAFRKEILKNRGPHSNDYCVDAVIQGDGERAFYQYVSEKPLAEINNLVYQEKSGIKENNVEVLDLDDTPFFDRDLIDFKKYFYENRRRLHVYAHKGCNWRKKTGGCFFCSSLDKNFRSKRPELFVKEIERLVSKYRINTIEMIEEDFLGDLEWFKYFFRLYCKYIKGRYDHPQKAPFLSISARVDRITPQVVKMLKGINVGMVFMGFESGDQRCLSIAKKGISLSDMINTVELLDKNQIRMVVSFIVGLPNDNRKSLKKTLSLVKKLSLSNFIDFRFRGFLPLPGSPSWQMFLKKIGSKYKDKDDINWREVGIDWIKNFCNFDSHDIEWLERELKILSQKIGKRNTNSRIFLFDKFV